MFRHIIALIILSYFSFGTFCLPNGDFAAIDELPEMYNHCKAFEDNDMTPFDFITDHLINIDCLFDNHDNGDQQKPHSPFTFHHITPQLFFTYLQFQWSTVYVVHPLLENNYSADNILVLDFFSKILRPPIL
ncbi:hypothetical protein BH11BAC2_BH11BAC2_17370 [soil metagenome]